MKRESTRREFIATTATAVAGVAAAGMPLVGGSPLLGLSAPPDGPPDGSRPVGAARPFDPARVRLRAGPFLDAAEVNRRFLMSLDPARLLHMFRVTAGLPSSAAPLGGWESPVNELRGHFTGHYLSACALLAAGAHYEGIEGDEGNEGNEGDKADEGGRAFPGATPGRLAAKARGDFLVAELAQCQRALGSGYLSAFPEEFFDRLREGKQVWAPWYTLHKILAGLLDMATLAGNQQALAVAQGMAAWAGRWVRPLGEAQMARVLEREYGGMNEALYNLAALTGKGDGTAYRELAHQFDHQRIFTPLAAGRDELRGLHANTTIPKILGAARRYELTGEAAYRQIAEYFWRQVTGRRSYCTGGSSNGEEWGSEPGMLGAELSGYTQECCVTYNMLKLSRHVFCWTADPACADYMERALWNGILGTQHPADGSKLYYVPLAAGYWKLFGTPLNDFWCCTGSGAESFARLGESIYFQGDGLYVNQYIASELDWRERGVRLVQDTRFPRESVITLRVRAAAPVRFPLRLRVPDWAQRAGQVRLNGRLLDGFSSPGSYFVLDRTWKDGDRVELDLPLSLHAEPLPGDDRQQAVLYGPLVLAGRLGTAGLTAANLRAVPTAPRTVPEYKSDPVPAPPLRLEGADIAAWLEPIPGRPLEFRPRGQAANLALAPLHAIYDERYAVYWRQPPPAAET